jgi:hypothetical protein
MRGIVAATAVLGVVAIAGLPSLALTLADDDTGTGTGSSRVERDGPPGWARARHDVPPGWARNHAGAAPHGWAVREWAHCVADAAAHRAEGEKLDPEAACGARPEPPRGPRR